MPRPLRIEFPGALYHVTGRAFRRRIYAGDSDRAAFLDILADAIDRFGWICHAYCLMDDRYHLLIETPRANLSRGMRHLNGVYTQRYNLTHRKTGPVFHGRFNAVLVEKNRHFLNVSRDVVLNPVRDGKASAPGKWPWSGYRATAGLRKAPPWLDTASTLAHFGKRTLAAQRAYRAFVLEGIDTNSPWSNVVTGHILGSKKFAAKSRATVTRKSPRPSSSKSASQNTRPKLKTLFAHIHPKDKPTRNAAILQAYLQHEYTMAAIANHLDIHLATVSRIISDAQRSK